MRQPRLFTEDPPDPLRIQADSSVLVVNHPPVDGFRGPDDPYYDVADVRERVSRLFGDVAWAPIGPSIRDLLVKSDASLDLMERDWVNVLDVDEWRVERERFRAARPVIGRHSRDHRTKWPGTASELLAAYPASEDVAVKVLGGADSAIRTLGYQPRNWTVYPFGSMRPARFLDEIDFFVYYHHSAWVESFGRNVIEAMASGCPAILPPHFEKLFAEHCLYAEPRDVRGLVGRLYGDADEYRAWSGRAEALVESDFSAGTHARRIRELTGFSPAAAAVSPGGKGRPRRILMLSTEPRGIGSITRLLRVAARFGERMQPVLLAPWPALLLGRDSEVLAELIPDHELDEGAAAGLADRILSIAELHQVDGVVVDAPRPTSALRRAVEDATIPFVRISTGAAGGAGGAFAATVELGDAALDASAPADVLPATGTPLPAEAARAELGQTGERPLALLCAGSDERAVAVPRVRLVAEALLEAGWSVVFAEPRQANGSDIRLPPGVHRRTTRPLTRYLQAFDAAVAAPGHTLTHELIAARCPALLIPFGHDERDEARAAAASERGFALTLDAFTEDRMGAGVAQLGDEQVRRELSATSAAVELRDAAPGIVEAIRRVAAER
jgi:hypothetical protein